MVRTRFLRAAVSGLGIALLSGAAWPQAGTPDAPRASPPAATLTQPPSDAPGASAPTPAPAPAANAALPTLVPGQGDVSDVDEVVLPAKPVAILSGQSNWDDGLKNIRGAFDRIRAGLTGAGLKPAGRPLTVFADTTDDSFKFEAMIPIEAAPAPGAVAPPGLRFGTTPSGKAYRFTHKAAYDEIDATYETITAYLDAKDITAKDAFIEEYLNDVADPADAALEINIFVQPK